MFVIILLGLVLSPAAARAEQAVYDLSIRGFKVGELRLDAQESGSRYSVTGRIRNTGVTRMFRQFSYQGTANGRIQRGRLAPARYEEAADTGRRQSSAELRYQGGVPSVVRYASPRESGPDSPSPASQGGTVDPLTASYALLRTVPPAQACNVDHLIFDGARQSRMFMRPAGQSGGLPVCKGQYQRLKGFTAEEVSRHRSFNFTLTYRQGSGGQLVVDRVSFDSLYGKAVIERR